jgi:hypothetical protein
VTTENQETEVLASQNGQPQYATADELLTNAPQDIREEDVTNVFGGLTVRIRGLTAAQAAHVKSVSFNMQGKSPEVGWGQMEIAQFEMGVIRPKLSHEQVIMLHRMSGPSFTKVIEALDALSGIGKDELRKAQQEFQEARESG